MKIICLVKFIPDVDNFVYDYEKNSLVRENVNLVLNPDDACALAFALGMKQKDPQVQIEAVSMGPESLSDPMRDLLRRKVDKATLISDTKYRGSDTYVTSRIIARYLQQTDYQLILTGTHSLDGDTAHIPSQIAELLHRSHMSYIIKFEEAGWNREQVVFDAELENKIVTFRMNLPAVLSVSKESNYKLPFVRYADLELDVEDRLCLVSNKDLGFDEDEVGISGSPTKVTATYTKRMEKKEKVVRKNDEEGIECIYRFLCEKGFIAYE